MYEKLDKCPGCSSSSIGNHFICTDHVVSGESFALSACQDCELVFTNPRPVKDLMGNYYKSENYVPHTKRKGVFNQIYRAARSLNIRNKLKLLPGDSFAGKLLDVGCGTGEFLAACKKSGWDVTGVEPHFQANSASAEILGISIHTDISQVTGDNTFEVITFWHALEHIYELHETIDHAKRLLTKSGRILIALPNRDSLDAGIYGPSWAGYDVPRHLYHFNQNSFSRLAREHGLKLTDKIPLRFDAYFVSLLSEKYKTGSRNWVRSFITGYKSNSYANSNQKNFSSIIYILKK
ncbi:MAG TPA: class I SAM-dependent methyltransferase [Cyclobacteriaceae bacterium]|nr:class I SAM-dependent methyltransferase [Cyclobacteriaceae bacterium]